MGARASAQIFDAIALDEFDEASTVVRDANVHESGARGMRAASQTSLAESPHCHFAFVAELFNVWPPGRGDFSVSNFHPGPILENLA